MTETARSERPAKIWSTLGKGVGILAVGLVTWATSMVWGEFEGIREGQTAILERVSVLEEDKAKWATMASMERQLTELRVQVEVMRQVWSYEYGREVPTGFPQRVGEPQLRPPEDLFRDLEQYRNMKQQQFPIQKK